MSTVSKVDREAWASARSLPDLGLLTALWLEGAITSQPGYHGPCDIEDPALVPLLARLNRSGFVTTSSQIGSTGPGFDGAHWEQRAAVEGFADRDDASALAYAAGRAGLTCVSYSPSPLPRWRYRYDRSVTVTTRAGQSYTRFGVQVPRRHIRDAHIGYGVCHRNAQDALRAAWQVTVIDPEWGRESLLWDVLADALAASGRRS